jgi:RimJ/RimL family protein N-acetyltransferase
MNNKKNVKNIEVRDLNYEDVPKVINLIKKIYGKEYHEKEFYEPIVIHSIIKDSKEKKRDKVYWKGGFLGNTLIGQMLFIIRNGAGFLECTMVDDEFKGKRVITRISLEMVKILEEMKDTDVKCIYAFVHHKNVPIIKILNNFGFYYYGTIPAHENGEYLLVYGRIVYDFKWKMINPHIKLCPELFKIIKRAKLKRLISALETPGLLLPHQKIKDIKITRLSNSYPYKLIISTEDGTTLAELLENKFQKSWYDFRINKNLTLDIKKQIIKKIIQIFQNHMGINSLSFIIEIDDKMTQSLLLNLGAKLYAILPFYFEKNDMILMGFSKIEEEVKENA